MHISAHFAAVAEHAGFLPESRAIARIVPFRAAHFVRISKGVEVDFRHLSASQPKS